MTTSLMAAGCASQLADQRLVRPQTLTPKHTISLAGRHEKPHPCPQVVRRNLLTSDWCDDAHTESLLCSRNGKWSREMMNNVWLSCVVAGGWGGGGGGGGWVRRVRGPRKVGWVCSVWLSCVVAGKALRGGRSGASVWHGYVCGVGEGASRPALPAARRMAEGTGGRCVRLGHPTRADTCTFVRSLLSCMLVGRHGRRGTEHATAPFTTHVAHALPPTPRLHVRHVLTHWLQM